VLRLDDVFARELPELAVATVPDHVPAPALRWLDTGLAVELGVDPVELAAPAGVDVLVGNVVPAGAHPVAQAYAGHQFGNLSPRLGDGRAVLLGELVLPDGTLRDLHLKGSGRTVFARGGDGKAALGPMLREVVVSAAMHALGIPTTRALAVVATGEDVHRETTLPGAVLARTAASHLRVGSFQFAAMHGGPDLVRRLADHAIGRHHPDLADEPAHARYRSLFDRVLDAQASLVAQWMAVGFVHGVMNTDNTTISGETIDFGPCAFMDAYDPTTVFSSIDHGGRYAYGNQPAITQWNLARLAEPMLPLFLDDPVDGADLTPAVELATDALHTFPARYERVWRAALVAKLGLRDDDRARAFVDDTITLLTAHLVDMTSFFRALSAGAVGDLTGLHATVADVAALDTWFERWDLLVGDVDRRLVAKQLDEVNPVVVPRNHLVERALEQATAGDLTAFDRLVDAVTHPFEARPGFEEYALPDPTGGAGFRTFCGT
jgi:uncharacterized protein YdiU (UPF0061 family)